MPEFSTHLPLGPLMVDIPGTRLDVEDIALLRQPSVGAVILFSRNYQSVLQITELIKEIKVLRSPALLIAVDQEGGRVQRFQEGFFPLPAAHRFSKDYDHDPARGMMRSRSAGALMASELIQTGVDFSFAPVLDSVDLNSKVIGDRGFHSSAQGIVELAGAFIDGMNDAGMAATGKHFPGHGGVVEDSHVDLPVDNRNHEQMENSELIPYRKLSHKLGGIMTAHVKFPNIDEYLPTFSRYWLEKVLRQKIGFQGLIFSDDLSMKGADIGGTFLERTRLALTAGCDMALICNQAEAANEVADQLTHSTIPNQDRYEAMRSKPVPSNLSLDRIKEMLAEYC